ncbi:MAG: putative lipid II flippase FtsW [Bdellovibrionales bacterium]|nr:putative lipid II flippase FtsW [Bdellovibrionales bacterium]
MQFGSRNLAKPSKKKSKKSQSKTFKLSSGASSKPASQLDQGVLLSVLFLVGAGLVQVYSSSFIYAIATFQNGHHFFFRQLMFSGLGILSMIFVAKLKWKYSKWLGVALFVVAIAGIAATFVPSLTISAGGARRWVRLPLGQRFEPGEFFKLTFPLLLAVLLTTKQIEKLGRFDHLRWLAILLPFALLLKQPDFGTVALLSMTTIAVLFVFGMSWKYLFYMGAAAVPALYFLVIQVPYRWARVQGFLDPWSDPSEKGFQIIQSLLSFHSGGVFGAGLGQGLGKLFFLPEAHTDFTLAVLGEEVGLIGFLVILFLYGFLVFRGFQIASRVRGDFERVVALGFVLIFGFQVFINMGVVLGLLPTKGITLPFLSYGGSSLVATCIGFGWLLNIERSFARSKQSTAMSSKERSMVSSHYWNSRK